MPWNKVTYLPGPVDEHQAAVNVEHCPPVKTFSRRSTRVVPSICSRTSGPPFWRHDLCAGFLESRCTSTAYRTFSSSMLMTGSIRECMRFSPAAGKHCIIFWYLKKEIIRLFWYLKRVRVVHLPSVVQSGFTDETNCWKKVVIFYFLCIQKVFSSLHKIQIWTTGTDTSIPFLSWAMC